jgi:hypothetical protein
MGADDDRRNRPASGSVIDRWPRYELIAARNLQTDKMRYHSSGSCIEGIEKQCQQAIRGVHEVTTVTVSWIIRRNGDTTLQFEDRQTSGSRSVFTIALPAEGARAFTEAWPRHAELREDDATIGGHIEVDVQDDD